MVFSSLRAALLLALTISLLPAPLSAQSSSPVVRIRTNLGDIDVQLLPGSAPGTVENFLKYMRRGSYNNSVFHRSVPGFIIQGGGFTVSGVTFTEIPNDGPIRNEFRESNLRGTIAMAKLGSDPNSATTQWFFNLADNSGNLNNQNGGFTVFGRVANAASLAVMDRIAAVPVPNPGPLGSPFDAIPLQNYTSGAVQNANFIIVTNVAELESIPNPVISENGIVSAAAYGGYRYAAPGSFLEIYGANLAGNVTRGWAGSDFTNGNAPTNLEGTSVTIGGQRAFIYFVSPTQINVQVPATVSTGITLPVVVTYNGAPSAAASLEIRNLAPGLLAPSAFRIGDRQYVYAVNSSDNTVVSSGNLPGTTNRPARPGETLIFYGVGFGFVSPFSTSIAGRIVSGTTTVAAPLQFRFGGETAQIAFAGLVPGLVGLYQFNVVMPSVAAAGDVALEVTVNGERMPQTLFLAAQPR
jgi:uncharacterized protein (TIGR03437 family)